MFVTDQQLKTRPDYYLPDYYLLFEFWDTIYIGLTSNNYPKRSLMMDTRTLKNNSPAAFSRSSHHHTTTYVERRKMEYQRSFSQGHDRKMKSYFTLQSLFLLICLTASLLVLPLILPPLPPPPPFMLLLLPICLVVVLMFLAFLPSNVTKVTNNNYTYM